MKSAQGSTLLSPRVSPVLSLLASQVVPVDIGCYFPYDNKPKTFDKVDAMFINMTIQN